MNLKLNILYRKNMKKRIEIPILPIILTIVSIIVLGVKTTTEKFNLAAIEVEKGKTTTTVTDASASLNLSKTEVERGETFTVILHAECEKGINGLSTEITYDEEKLEVVDKQVIDTSKWVNIGAESKIEILHNTQETATSVDLIKLTFKVKETAEEGTTAKITALDIELDSDEATNSEKKIGTKEAEITIVENLSVNINEYETTQEGENKYLRRIIQKTDIQTLLQKIETNGLIEVFKGETKITDQSAKLGTGMNIKITLNNEIANYKVVIAGDIDGNGDADFNDILQVNKHRLNRTELTNEYFKAADVTGDEVADFDDILKINKYRLHRIESL